MFLVYFFLAYLPLFVVISGQGASKSGKGRSKGPGGGESKELGGGVGGLEVGKAWPPMPSLARMKLVGKGSDLDRIDGDVAVSVDAMKQVADGNLFHMNTGATLAGVRQIEYGSACFGTSPNIIVNPAFKQAVRDAIPMHVRNATTAPRSSSLFMSCRRAPLQVSHVVAALSAAGVSVVRVTEFGGEYDLAHAANRAYALSDSTPSQLDISQSFWLPPEVLAGKGEFDPQVWLFSRGSLGGGMTVLPFGQTEGVLEAYPDALHAGMVKVSAKTVAVMLEMIEVELPEGLRITDIVL